MSSDSSGVPADAPGAAGAAGPAARPDAEGSHHSVSPAGGDPIGGGPGAPGVSTGRLTVGLCVAVTAIAFEAISVATAMPAAAEDLGHLAWYAWAFSTFQVGTLFATAAAGRLSDRIGPVRPMIAGMVIFSVGLLVAGLAPTMVQLIIGRAVQGIGGGTMSVALYVLVARVYPERSRPQLFSWLSTAWVMPSFLGPPVAAYLTHALSWHWVFFAVIPLVALTAGLTLPLLLRVRRSGADAGHEPTNPAPLWAGLLVACAVPAAQLAGQRLDGWSIPLLAVGLTLLAVGLPRLMPRGLFRLARGISAVVVVRGMVAGVYFAAESFIPLMLVETRHLPLILAGAVLTVGAIGWTTGSWVQSRRRLTLRRDRIVTLGVIAVCLGIASTALVSAFPTLWVGLVAVSWVLGGLGMGLAYSSTSLVTMTLSPVPELGRNSASLQLAEALGGALLTSVAGTLFAALHPNLPGPTTFGVVIGSMSVLALLAIVASLRIGAVKNVA